MIMMPFEGCCGVVLDHEKYANVSVPAGLSGFRQKNWNSNLMTDEISTLIVGLCV